MRNVVVLGLASRETCDSEQVFKALQEASCGPRPAAGSIAGRLYAMEVT